MIERKVCEGAQLKILDTDGSSGRLSGYASTFANVDRVGERVVKGAFAESIPTFLKDGFIALDHDWRVRVAMPDIAREDDYGLWIESDFHSTPDAQEARVKAMERLNKGKSVSLSIGYEVQEDSMEENVRLLKKLNLFEVSLVSVPANPLAQLAGAKGGLLAGLPMDAHSDAVLAAVADFSERAKSLSDLRAKEGRVLSAANRRKLESLISQLQELMTATEPKADPDEVRKAVAQLLMHEAQARVFVTD